MGQVAVIASGKGGTGKTTLCAGIASCLAAEGQRVLCIDADIGLRNLDISLGMSDLAYLSFADMIQGLCSFDDLPQHPQIPGLFLLSAPVAQSPEHIPIAGFQQLLTQARASFDWCLIDAPAGIGAGFRLATAAADRAIVVSTGDPASLRDAARAAELLTEQSIPLIELAVNRVAPKLLSTMGATIDDMMDTVGLPLLGLVPEDPNVVLAAANGTPLIAYTHRGAAVACLHLARRMNGRHIGLMRLRRRASWRFT